MLSTQEVIRFDNYFTQGIWHEYCLCHFFPLAAAFGPNLFAIPPCFLKPIEIVFCENLSSYLTARVFNVRTFPATCSRTR